MTNDIIYTQHNQLRCHISSILLVSAPLICTQFLQKKSGRLRRPLWCTSWMCIIVLCHILTLEERGNSLAFDFHTTHDVFRLKFHQNFKHLVLLQELVWTLVQNNRESADGDLAESIPLALWSVLPYVSVLFDQKMFRGETIGKFESVLESLYNGWRRNLIQFMHLTDKEDPAGCASECYSKMYLRTIGKQAAGSETSPRAEWKDLSAQK